MEELIADFGYIAIFIGTFLEGELVLALGGVAAAHGYLSFIVVVCVAITGGFLGDQTASGSAGATGRGCSRAIQIWRQRRRACRTCCGAGTRWR